MNKFLFKTNINCSSCVKKVTPTLNELDNVDSWFVDTDHIDKVLTVELDDNDFNLVISAIVNAGFNIEKL